MLLIILAAIGGFLVAYSQKQECVSETLNQKVYCEVDRANWGADKRQIKALHASWNECERKLTDVNNKLNNVTEKYNAAALEKKAKEVQLDGKTKDVQAIKTCQERLMEYTTLYGGAKDAEIRLERENKELKNKIAECQERINAQSREQQRNNQHSHDEV